MAIFKMKIAGRDVTFQSEDDAARLLAALERVDETPERNGKSGRNAAHGKTYDALRSTVDFLEEIVAHREGVQSSAIAQSLGCNPRGIGRRLLEVDAILKPLGFKRASVYDHSKRLAEGGRLYLPGPDVQAALDAVKRKAGSG